MIPFSRAEPQLNKTMIETKTPFKAGETYLTRHKSTGSMGTAKVLHIQDSIDSMWCAHFDNSGTFKYVAIHDDMSGESHGHSMSDLIPPAPPMKRVPLGPEDVPPGSVIRFGDIPPWAAVISVSDTGIRFSHPRTGMEMWPFGDCLANSIMIKRPGEDWHPMWKEAPEDSTND